MTRSAKAKGSTVSCRKVRPHHQRQRQRLNQRLRQRLDQRHNPPCTITKVPLGEGPTGRPQFQLGDTLLDLAIRNHRPEAVLQQIRELGGRSVNYKVRYKAVLERETTTINTITTSTATPPPPPPAAGAGRAR